MHYHSHLTVAVRLLDEYKGEEPFHLYLKRYFKSQPKHGSRDRKLISQLCYSAFRLGKAAHHLSTEQQILAGYFLCNHQPSALLQQLKPDWAEYVESDINTKLKNLTEIDISQIFPWQDEWSPGINRDTFITSHFRQPLMFLRVRPGMHTKVKQKLKDIAHEWIGENTVAIENSTNIKDVFLLNKEVVIQDISSQEVGGVLVKAYLPAHPSVWDCCAASGGKSILAKDIFGKIELTVSDIRPSILANLKERLREAEIKVGSLMVADLTDEKLMLPETTYDLVIADVPCSGSGTWGRTPEQLFYFDKEKINHYVGLQEKILNRITAYVKPGGYILYCTCSIFSQENETQVEKFLLHHTFEKIAVQLIPGYERRADTLFAALLRKPL